MAKRSKKNTIDMMILDDTIKAQQIFDVMGKGQHIEDRMDKIFGDSDDSDCMELDLDFLQQDKKQSVSYLDELTSSHKTVHKDFYNNFGDLFDDTDLESDITCKKCHQKHAAGKPKCSTFQGYQQCQNSNSF
jgi:hypothetical protein